MREKGAELSRGTVIPSDYSSISLASAVPYHKSVLNQLNIVGVNSKWPKSQMLQLFHTL